MKSLLQSIRVAVLLVAALAFLASLAVAGDKHTSKPFQGPKANTGTVTHWQDGDKNMLTFSDDFKTPETPDPHVQIVDSAIAVSDTERSLKFYRDLLGLRVAGESENYETEQEHLNNVFGARLQITGLRAASGPGIEFLEYLTLRDGRPTPVDIRANDIMHWQTALITRDAEAVFQRLRGGQVSL